MKEPYLGVVAVSLCFMLGAPHPSGPFRSRCDRGGFRGASKERRVEVDFRFASVIATCAAEVCLVRIRGWPRIRASLGCHRIPAVLEELACCVASQVCRRCKAVAPIVSSASALLRCARHARCATSRLGSAPHLACDEVALADSPLTGRVATTSSSIRMCMVAIGARVAIDGAPRHEMPGGDCGVVCLSFSEALAR